MTQAHHRSVEDVVEVDSKAVGVAEATEATVETVDVDLVVGEEPHRQTVLVRRTDKPRPIHGS